MALSRRAWIERAITAPMIFVAVGVLFGRVGLLDTKKPRLLAEAVAFEIKSINRNLPNVCDGETE